MSLMRPGPSFKAAPGKVLGRGHASWSKATARPAALRGVTRTYSHHHETDSTQHSHPTVACSATEFVDEALERIKGTNNGIDVDKSTRSHVDGLISALEREGATQQPRPLDNPLLWGNYEVAYTSTANAEQRGEPAGGRFRGGLGRMLFRTSGLYQSVLQPDIATNKVDFKLFGAIPGSVGLRGKLVPIGERKDTVRVLFEPPVLSVGNSIHIRIGPPSNVVLTTTYLDERVRLGKGSRGSLFVFTRGGAADSAEMDKVGLQQTTKGGMLMLGAFFTSLLLGGAAFWQTGSAPLRALSGVIWLLALLVGAVVNRGGSSASRQEALETQQQLDELKKREQEAAMVAAAAASEGQAEQQQQQQQRMAA